MAEERHDFKFVISAVDQATANIRAVKASLQGVIGPIRQINAAYAGLRQELTPVRNALTGLRTGIDQVSTFAQTRLALPAAAIGGFAIKQAADFEEATNNVKVLAGYAEDYTDAAKEAIDGVVKKARELAKSTKFGPTDVMNAFGILLGNDPDLNKAYANIEPVLTLATATRISPDEAAKLNLGLQAAFPKLNLSSPEAANLLAKLRASSAVEMNAFGESLKNFAGQSAVLQNSSPIDILAATGVMSRALNVGSTAGTHLAISLRELNMLSSSMVEPQKIEAMQKLGVRKDQIFEIKNGTTQLRSLRDILEALAPHAENPLLGKIVGSDALPSIQFILTNMGNFAQLSKDIQSQIGLTLQQGSAFAQAKAQMMGFNGSMHELQGSVEELMIRLGESGLLRDATALVRELESIVEWLAKLDDGTLQTAIKVGAVTIAIAALGNTLGGIVQLAQVGIGPMSVLLTKLIAVKAASDGAAVATAGVGASVAATFGRLGTAISTAGPIIGAILGLAAAIAALKAYADSQNPFEHLGKATTSREEFQKMLREGNAAQLKASLLKKLPAGQSLTPAEQLFLENIRLNRSLGLDDEGNPLPGTKLPQFNGSLEVRFPNLPRGTTITTDPNGNLPINLEVGRIMPKDPL